ncbi:TPA: hypothetical protein TVE77_000654 [Streptococcus equi subsp. zooepidemicus]|uniref:hypothetical protein n=1 Tax=Streptococcus equi TaxID=1336 RepID=UPI001E3FD468|nr:hypothetical protein [Streptococcus equi]MCD3373390.1 hypothetical protein [Streptococcus equi subsp. zooepidemicus]MCD3386533.1 hypothetical protein [Streptococcus equi subsp. zooepidemicus]MCD3389223.1 hypothetical protein [Streptococcus equi subsp. zooepidemicus]MCD3422326.1 hypothetical protein [Streptococcus equi subsp. zooepidemicus]HEK9955742.1 hypothetical protein [Streptococcus equi subsp. zooepidemicus]
MERSQLTWEEVSQYEEVKGYGQQVWKHKGEYYLVREEGGIATQRVVYKLPNELFQLLDSGRKSLLEIDFYVKNNCWPPNISQEEANRLFWRKYPEVLKNNKNAQKLFTRKELEELLPKGSLILASSDSD